CSLGKHLNAGSGTLFFSQIVEERIARERSDESVRQEFLVRLTLPHTLDCIGSERTVAEDSGHETHIITVIDTDEVKTLDDVTYLDIVFAFHIIIIAFFA
ncbi:MAG: hypothetical protein ACO3P3_06365, partial [Candidatus Nanopelagicales bacterium]